MLAGCGEERCIAGIARPSQAGAPGVVQSSIVAKESEDLKGGTKAAEDKSTEKRPAPRKTKTTVEGTKRSKRKRDDSPSESDDEWRP